MQGGVRMMLAASGWAGRTSRVGGRLRLDGSPTASAQGRRLGWPKRCELARGSMWEYSYKKAGVGPTSGPTWQTEREREHLHAELVEVAVPLRVAAV